MYIMRERASWARLGGFRSGYGGDIDDGIYTGISGRRTSTWTMTKRRGGAKAGTGFAPGPETCTQRDCFPEWMTGVRGRSGWSHPLPVFPSSLVSHFASIPPSNLFPRFLFLFFE